METTPTISVIIPLYNCKPYIDVCLDSILRQKVQDYEIILVDDFSSDGSLEYVSSTRKDTRIRVRRNVSKGANSARQLGVQMARGEFILFSDADDLWEPNAFFNMMNIARKFRPSLVVCNLNYVNTDGSKKMSYIDMPSINDTININREPRFIGYVNPNAVAKLFSKDILVNLDFKNVYFSQDWNITYKALLNAESIYFLNKPVYNYIRRKNSITSSTNTYTLDKIIFSLESFDDVLCYLRQGTMTNRNDIWLEYNILYIKFLYNFLAKGRFLSSIDRAFLHRTVKSHYNKYFPVTIESSIKICKRSLKYLMMLFAIRYFTFYNKILPKHKR